MPGTKMLRLSRKLRFLRNRIGDTFKRTYSDIDGPAKLTRRENVGIITLKNPPVNALSHSMKVQIVESMQEASKDSAVKSVIIHGDGKGFSAGADINKFSNPKIREPFLQDIIKLMEEFPKPVIAAVHGFAFGGSFQLVLGAHYRVADATASFSSPEVQFGGMPSIMGTQRLLRVADIPTTINMITTGTKISSKVALECGLVDQIIEGDLVHGAIKFAQRVADEPLDDRRVSKRPIGSHDPKIFQEALWKISQRSRGAITPVFAIKAVQAAAEMTAEDEIASKQSTFSKILKCSTESKALQYAFLSERKLSQWKIPNSDVSYKTAKPFPINSGAVIGGGTMGSGIALNFITNGIPVSLVELNQEVLDKAVKMIQGLVMRDVILGRISETRAKERLSLLNPTMDYDQLKNADIVIEAVFENMQIKKEIFQRLDQVCKPETILASNTSGLDIDEMASVTSRPDKVMGTHFFSPAHIMKLLENVRGKDSSPETIATGMDLGRRLKKISVLVGNSPHFVGNRMLGPYAKEAIFCLEEGALPHEVDQVLLDFGLPMGLLRMGDMAGMDINYKSRQDFGYITSEGQEDRFRKNERYCPLSDILVEKGRIGQKVGKGWYSYDKPGGKDAKIDPEVTDIILEYCKRHSIQRRRLPPQEIHERCLFPLLNEGFKTLEEGMASSEEDIDMVWLYGYGWPRHTGGPMFYARNNVGLNRLYERLLYYQGLDPLSPHWQPSKLLEDMVSAPASP